MKQEPAFFLSKGGDGGKIRLVVACGITASKVRGYAKEYFPETEKGALLRTPTDKVPKRFTSPVALNHLMEQSFTIAILEICKGEAHLKWVTTSKKKKQLSVTA